MTATIFLTDMSRCLPHSALADERQKSRWWRLPYKAGDIDGVMLGASTQVRAPDVTLPLGATGWHHIYVGYWNPHHDYDGDVKLKLKLTGDDCYRTIHAPILADKDWPGSSWMTATYMKEAFVTTADLAGRDLVIGQHHGGTPFKAYLAWVRLVSLDAAEAKQVQADRERSDTRILYSFNDGNGMFGKGQTTREDLLEEIEQYRHSDVGAFVFAASCGDIVNYPSEAGTIFSSMDDSFMHTEGKLLHRTMKGLLDKGIVPIQLLAEHAHEMGIAFHAQFRMAIGGHVPPCSTTSPNGLVCRRPDLRMIERDGTAVEKASYAFPETRKVMLSMIREVAANYDVDGINLCFIRGPQYVGYEAPVVEDFKKDHGVDPRTLDHNDLRLQRHRARYVTELVREARALVIEAGREKTRKVELSAVVCSGQVGLNLFYGFDILSWLEEGLLDSIFVSGEMEPGTLRAIRAAGCRLIHTIPPDSGDAAAWLRDLGYDSGVDGIWYWDMNFEQEHPEFWNRMRRIGHRMQEGEAADAAHGAFEPIPITSVGGCELSNVANKGVGDGRFEPPVYGPPELLHVYSLG